MSLEKEYLTYPGNGVYTVKTAEEKKLKVLKKLYNTDDFENAEKAWKESFNRFEESSVCILGAPSDVGAGIVRGSNWGPLAIREKIQNKYFDLGDIKVIPHLIHDDYLSEKSMHHFQKVNYDGKNHPVSALSILEKVSSDFFKNHQDKFLLTLGGDHSISRPLSESFLDNFSDIGVLHFDAHTDLMDERLGVEHCFATWAYHCAKKLDNPKKMIQVGIRSSGKEKAYWEDLVGLTQFWSEDVKKLGPHEISSRIVKQYKSLGVKKLYLSFDIDAFDKSIASATGTPEENGLLIEETLEILRLVTKEIPIKAADLVEVAPFISYDENQTDSISKTLKSAMSIVNFLFNHWNK